MEEIYLYVSTRVKEALVKIPDFAREKVEEIRIRIDRPIELVVQTSSYFLMENGELTTCSEQGMKATAEDGQKILNLISRHSLYALEEELRRGYITVRGGHRIGIAGKAVMESGKVKHVKDIRSFNIRLAKEKKGVALQVIDRLKAGRSILNTLIISPPRCGKTTLLRDLTRLLSSGDEQHGIAGQRVCVVDERSEIGASIDGVPQHDLGPRTDIMDSCPKAEGMMMMIRSMGPDYLICDEIGSREDVEAIMEAVFAGVTVIATAHGLSVEEVQHRPNLQPLFAQHVFQRFITLSNRQGAGTIEAVTEAKSYQRAISVC